MRASASARPTSRWWSAGRLFADSVSKRREVVAQARREELEQMDGGRDVLQAMPPERSIRAIGNGRFSGHVASCP